MATQILPLINGKAYSYSDVTIIFLGVPVVGITAIEYGVDSAEENIYGLGRDPIARGSGHRTPTAKLTILMGEVQNIVSQTVTGRLNDIPEFDIIVSYTDASLISVVHKIRNCKFVKQQITSATGDTSIPMEMELITSHIEWK